MTLLQLGARNAAKLKLHGTVFAVHLKLQKPTLCGPELIGVQNASCMHLYQLVQFSGHKVMELTIANRYGKAAQMQRQRRGHTKWDIK